jgi:hypothetical protein
MCRYVLTIFVLALGAGCGAEPAQSPPTPSPSPDLGPEVSQEPDLTDEPDLPAPLCEAGQSRCLDRSSVEVCTDDGDGWLAARCRGDERCDDEAQACRPVICVAGDVLRCTGDTTYEYCNTTGTRTIAAPCPNNSPCADGRCASAACVPGQLRCDGLRDFTVCLEDGSAYGPSQPCPVGQECDANECQDLCTLNQKVSSYIGCEYWSLDLDNYDDAIDQPHAVVVSNPNPELTARVTVTRPDGSPIEHFGPAEIAPLTLGVYTIPPNWNLSPIAINDFAVKVSSNIPVTAHQFNPLNNVDVFSNDGSLLLPTNALGTEYLVMSWKQRPSPPLRGFMTIANPNPLEARVTVTASARTAPGDGIPTLEPGQPREFVLPPGHVLNLETRDDLDDLTGSEVRSDLPVAVFGGHECANVDLGIDRCDHIESQLFPVNTWGSQYVGSKFASRGGEPDVWRVLSSVDGTVVTLSMDFPNPEEQVHQGELIRNEGGAQFRLDRGQFAEFQSKEPFWLDATSPVSLGHYMVGSNWFTIPRICDQGIDAGNPTGIGDPALTIEVPLTQFRDNYILLVPLDYELDYVNVIAPEGAQVFLDGEPVDAALYAPVAQTPWRVATLEVPDGPHVLTGDQPFGLTAYGYDCHVSYAYPGGLNLEPSEDR